jgi:hypothetical protein
VAESGSRTPASVVTAKQNALKIAREPGPTSVGSSSAQSTTTDLRRELSDKGLPGFKKGGKVKKTGVYKLHKGEKVLTASAAKKHR